MQRAKKKEAALQASINYDTPMVETPPEDFQELQFGTPMVRTPPPEDFQELQFGTPMVRIPPEDFQELQFPSTSTVDEHYLNEIPSTSHR